MNKQEQEYIRIMRNAGCSYREIAKTLNMPRGTISSYCLRNSIYPIRPIPQKHPHYSVCIECGKFFLCKTKRHQHFCSDKCKNEYWKKDRADKATLEAKARQYQTLQKELDFLKEESDELDGGENAPLCRRKEEL